MKKNKYAWYDRLTGEKVKISTVRKSAKQFLINLKSGNIDTAVANFINNNYERREVINDKKSNNSTSSNRL